MTALNIATVVTLITETATLLGVIIPIIRSHRKIKNGQRCQLRSEMLRIYYHNKDTKEIRQYEFENFLLLYEAYKELGGNSFIDKIHQEVITWDVLT